MHCLEKEKQLQSLLFLHIPPSPQSPPNTSILAHALSRHHHIGVQRGVRTRLDSSFLSSGTLSPEGQQEEPEVTPAIHAAPGNTECTPGRLWDAAQGARARSAPGRAEAGPPSLSSPGHLVQSLPEVRAGVSYWPRPLGGSTCPRLGDCPCPASYPSQLAPSQNGMSVLPASHS